MNTSAPTITTRTTAYLNALAANLKYVARNQKTLVAASINGDEAASEIITLFFTLAGDYRKSQVERFNTLVESYQETSAAGQAVR